MSCKLSSSSDHHQQHILHNKYNNKLVIGNVKKFPLALQASPAHKKPWELTAQSSSSVTWGRCLRTTRPFGSLTVMASMWGTREPKGSRKRSVVTGISEALGLETARLLRWAWLALREFCAATKPCFPTCARWTW